MINLKNALKPRALISPAETAGSKASALVSVSHTWRGPASSIALPLALAGRVLPSVPPPCNSPPIGFVISIDSARMAAAKRFNQTLFFGLAFSHSSCVTFPALFLSFRYVSSSSLIFLVSHLPRYYLLICCLYFTRFVHSSFSPFSPFIHFISSTSLSPPFSSPPFLPAFSCLHSSPSSSSSPSCTSHSHAFHSLSEPLKPREKKR